MNEAPLTVIVGVGEGLGRALAERFARAQERLVLLSRQEEITQAIQEDIRALGGVCHSLRLDCTKESEVKSVFQNIRDNFGHPQKLIYNVGQIHKASIMDLSSEEFESHWKTNCFGAFLVTKEVLPKMLEQGKGSLIFSGATASLRGGAHFASFAVGKMGLRAFCQSLAREFAPKGIHVSHVVLDGIMDSPAMKKAFPSRPQEGFLSTKEVAETYYQLSEQSARAWSHELELRPLKEQF